MSNIFINATIIKLYLHLRDKKDLSFENNALLSKLKTHSLIVKSFCPKPHIEKLPYPLKLNKTSNLIIVDFDKDNMLLTYDMENNEGIVKKAIIQINETHVLSDTFKFPLYHLNNFIFNNSEHYEQFMFISQ